MKNDQHETFRHTIDESLAGGISAERERSLRVHLGTCARCQEYLSASNRVIEGLRGFSFEVGPTFNPRVLSANGQPSRQCRQRWTLSNVAAVVLTVGGSFVDLRFGDLIASIFDIQRMQLRQGLLAFWIVPSLCIFALFPLLPLLFNAGSRRDERTQ
jgi:hypothetical protein